MQINYKKTNTCHFFYALMRIIYPNKTLKRNKMTRNLSEETENNRNGVNGVVFNSREEKRGEENL